MASHQAIREVVEAFNRGELQIEVTGHVDPGLEGPVVVKNHTIEIRVQPEDDQRRAIQMVIYAHGSTFGASI